MKAYFEKLQDSLRKHPSQLNRLSLFAIIFVMLFMTWCSPLIHYSYDATDMNVSMAIGKAMAHGQVYFKDILNNVAYISISYNFLVVLCLIMLLKQLCGLLKFLIYLASTLLPNKQLCLKLIVIRHSFMH